MNILGQYHTGFVVKNLDQSLHFYLNILGLKIERGPGVQSGKWLSDVVGLKNVELKMAFVGTGDGHSIELFEYVNPKGKGRIDMDKVFIPGSAHCAFLVDDILGWYKQLKENNLEIISNGEPKLRDKPYPWARYALYMKDPDGNVIEMTERATKPVESTEN